MIEKNLLASYNFWFMLETWILQPTIYGSTGCFSDTRFLKVSRSYGLLSAKRTAKFFRGTSIPEVRLWKSKKHNCWIARVWLADELFDYKYPFLLPDFLKQKNTKYDFEVRFEIMKVFSSVNIEKEFFIHEFFDSYPSVLSNQQRTKMKRSFIELVGVLKQHNLIDSNYKISFNGFLLDIDELTTNNISEGFVVYEKLSVSIFNY